ncbi:hypothetical protein GCK32_021254 [Trichostrongylus colubriformis]|uniref:Uncharacterized protein n=1 Tax=Trichostrongylus colubriformis TaxID=6319 RepID=A0AAN8FJN8_TRICO
MADRPLTGVARPPTALNPPNRPVTQQGLSGGRAVSRLGTGSMRQVHDKSYYMGLLRSKINQISTEIARLEEVYQKGQRDRVELDAYERRYFFNTRMLYATMHSHIDVQNAVTVRKFSIGDMQTDL